eukprot:gene8107-9656_t
MSVHTTLMLTQLNDYSYFYRLSCIFLAGKAEDNFVNLQELFKIYPKFPESRILECEIVLLESLNFHLKVFHPQNCVYSIIADIKRYTLENRTANESNGQSEQNEASLKAKLSAVANEWLTTSELNLCTLQSTGLVAKVNPLIIAICVLKLAAPIGLSEIVNFDQYLEDKFGADFLRENVTNGVLRIGECLRTGQLWSGIGSNSVENSMVNSGSDNSAELLSVCMKELKLKNKWKREVQQK